MSARCKAARTSFTPENDGLPLTTIMPAAALVSPSRVSTTARSPLGRSAMALARAVSLTACAASSASTDGSSSVCRDFS